MNRAYGVHPLTRVIVEFDDVYTLHDTIIDWFRILSPNHNWRYSHLDVMSFCVNEMIPESIAGNVPIPT